MTTKKCSTSYVMGLLLALCILGVWDAQAQVVLNMKLNPPLLPDEDVTTARLSPDGYWMVYLTEQTANKIITLYSIPSTGGVPFKFTEIVDPEILNQTPLNFYISPNSQWVVFILNPGPSNTIDIYCAPIAGGAPQLLCPPLSLESGMRMLSISPDSNWVVYESNSDGNSWPDVFSVPIFGGDPIKLNQNPDVGRAKIVSDSSKVIYTTHLAPNHHDLFSVPISGGPSTKLNDVLPVSNSNFQISNDGSRVLYRAINIVSESHGLFSVPTSGGNSVMLNLPFEFIGYVSSWMIEGNGKYVLFNTNEAFFADPVRLSKYFAVPIEGGTPVRLDNFNVDPSTYDIMDFGASHDGISALFAERSKESYNSAAGIYSTPLTGGTPVRLDPPNILGPDEELGWRYETTFDNKSLLLTTTLKGMLLAKNIYNVPLSGGTPVKLSHEVAENESVYLYPLKPDSQRILYTTYSIVEPEPIEIYSSSLDGGSVIRVNGDLVEGGQAYFVSNSPDNRTFYYLADQDTDEVFELYSSTLTCNTEQAHSTDINHDNRIVLSELIRSIQFYNIGSVSCMVGTEDGYYPGAGGDYSCGAYNGDYNPQDWALNMSELLRLIQLFAEGYYYACPGEGEDGFCRCEL